MILYVPCAHMCTPCLFPRGSSWSLSLSMLCFTVSCFVGQTFNHSYEPWKTAYTVDMATKEYAAHLLPCSWQCCRTSGSLRKSDKWPTASHTRHFSYDRKQARILSASESKQILCCLFSCQPQIISFWLWTTNTSQVQPQVQLCPPSTGNVQLWIRMPGAHCEPTSFEKFDPTWV